MTVRRLADQLTKVRREKQGIRRLLTAIAQMPPEPKKPEFETLHPYSELWNYVERDRERWN